MTEKKVESTETTTTTEQPREVPAEKVETTRTETTTEKNEEN